MQKSEYLKKIQDEIVKDLENNTIPWEEPWQKCYNPVTGTVYSGFNAFYLSLVSRHNGWTDPRFYTYNELQTLSDQLKQEGKEGLSFTEQHPTTIMYWQFTKSIEKKDENGNKIYLLDEKGNKIPELDRCGNPKTRFFNGKTYHIYKTEKIEIPLPCPIVSPKFLFNAQQVQNIPPFDFEKVKPIEFNREYIYGKEGEPNTGLIPNIPVPVIHDEPFSAYYQSNDDTIHIPEQKLFVSEEHYISTLLHEACHSTGHDTRLNRYSERHYHESETLRAEEEFKVEMTAYFLCDKAGIRYSNKEQSMSYLASWKQAIPNCDFNKYYDDVNMMMQYLEKPDQREKLHERAMNKAQNEEEKISSLER